MPSVETFDHFLPRTEPQRTRMKTLLLAAADALEEGVDPFSTNWLLEHDVSLYECTALAVEITDAIRFSLKADKQ